MPAFAGKLADDEIWAVLAYLKSQWTSADVLAARAEMTRNAKENR
jgi:mono/diheme cytochrome c family protein